MGSISRSVTEFCLDLYNKLNRNAEDTNIIFSPMSISVALALVHLGAKNNTAAQIEKVSINETCWDASTLLAVPLMETLGILAGHVCEGLIGNKQEYKHRCCLHRRAWCAMILAICLCELPHADSGQELNERRQYTTLEHSGFPPACCQDIRLCCKMTSRCFLLWLLWESRKCGPGWVVGRVAETWSDCVWVTGSISSLTTYDIRESKCLNLQSSQGPRWAGRRWRRPPLQLLRLYSPQCKFCFLQSSLFSFVPMSGNRPIILRQKFLSVADSVARYLHIRNNDWFPLRALWFWYIS